jgi:hypothetical protein
VVDWGRDCNALVPADVGLVACSFLESCAGRDTYTPSAVQLGMSTASLNSITILLNTPQVSLCSCVSKPLRYRNPFVSLSQPQSKLYRMTSPRTMHHLLSLGFREDSLLVVLKAWFV